MKRISKLDDRGFRVSTIDTLQLGDFLQFFLTNSEKIENVNFYIFPCNSNKNQATKSNVHQLKGNFV